MMKSGGGPGLVSTVRNDMALMAARCRAERFRFGASTVRVGLGTRCVFFRSRGRPIGMCAVCSMSRRTPEHDFEARPVCRRRGCALFRRGLTDDMYVVGSMSRRATGFVVPRLLGPPDSGNLARLLISLVPERLSSTGSLDCWTRWGPTPPLTAPRVRTNGSGGAEF
jgi:hypothetical protein